MFRSRITVASALLLCPTYGKSSITSMPMFSGGAPQRMMRGQRAKEAAQASKRAASHFDEGDITKAEAEWRVAVDTLRSKACGLGEDICILEPLNNLACAVGELGRGTEKLSLLDEHVLLVKKLYGDKHPQYVVSCYNKAAALGDAGRPRAMYEEMKSVVELQRSILPPGPRRNTHPKVARTLLGLADACARCGFVEERWRILHEALPMVVKHCGENHPQVAAVYLALCDAGLDLWASLRQQQQQRQQEQPHDGGKKEVLVQQEEDKQQKEQDATADPQQPVTTVVVLPSTSTDAAKLALDYARKAFSIESKVIPATSSHLLTHSRLALARSRAALSPNMSFSELAPFIGDIRIDIVNHMGETGKLLIPVFAFSAQDAVRRAMERTAEATTKGGEEKQQKKEEEEEQVESISDLYDAACQTAEMAFQVALRHFDATGHIETPRRMVELSAVHMMMANSSSSSSSSSYGGADEQKNNTAQGGGGEPTSIKIERWCTEALRRLDAMGAESDYASRVQAQKLLQLASANKNENTKEQHDNDIIRATVRQVLKF